MVGGGGFGAEVMGLSIGGFSVYARPAKAYPVKFEVHACGDVPDWGGRTGPPAIASDVDHLRFDILHRSSVTKARVGRIITPHGAFETPAFMPVGTRGSVKGLLPGLVAATGAQIILGNTYHLLLRPGPEIIARLGGLQRFTGWHGPMLTDSGGYQAYSLAATNRIDENGVTFKSVVDGSEVHLSPERAIAVQHQLGADIIMAFDDCPPSIDPTSGPDREAIEPTQPRLLAAVDRDARAARSEKLQAPAGSSGGLPRSRAYDHPARLRLANERTVRWLQRCKAEHERLANVAGQVAAANRQACTPALFGIIQGGTDLDARDWSREHICNINLPGYAIGGVAVGEHSEDIARIVAHTAPGMPDPKPRYLMGVGYERDIIAAVLSGIDMFDCVLPTRNGRNANAFTPTGQVRLRNAQFADDPRPIQVDCDCLACTGSSVGLSPAPPATLPSVSTGPSDTGPQERPFSRAYIRHLFMAKEMLGPILVSLHNLRHFQRLMSDVRATIRSNNWDDLIARWPVARPGLESARRTGVAS